MTRYRRILEIRFGDSADKSIQSDLSGCNFTVGSDLAFRVGVGDGNGGFFFMYIETDVEFWRRV